MFIETEQFEEFERGAKNDNSLNISERFVPQTDRVEVDELAQFALVDFFDGEGGEDGAHAEHGHRDDGEDDDGELVEVPEFLEVAELLVLELDDLGDEEVEEEDDKDDLEYEHDDAEAAQIVVELADLERGKWRKKIFFIKKL